MERKGYSRTARTQVMCVNGRVRQNLVSDAETTQTHRMVVKLKCTFVK